MTVSEMSLHGKLVALCIFNLAKLTVITTFNKISYE